MTNRTTDTSHCKIYLHLLARLRAGFDRPGRRLFAATDGTARQHGWQIISISAGLGRRYRDPRFDNLASCLRCRGSGARAPGSPCQTCAGTGRVTLTAQTTDPPVPRRSP
jgi:DnaJ-class molecular chaperone